MNEKSSTIIDVDAEDDELDDEDDLAKNKHQWPASIGKYYATHCKRCASNLSEIEPTLEFLTNMAGSGCGVKAYNAEHGKHKCLYCTHNTTLSNNNIVVNTLSGLKKLMVDKRRRDESCPYCQTTTRITSNATSAAGKGTRSCKLDWCNKRCINFTNPAGKWDSDRADKRRATLTGTTMSSDEMEGQIATAAGRCTGKRATNKKKCGIHSVPIGREDNV
jgi:hypothetical protein